MARSSKKSATPHQGKPIQKRIDFDKTSKIVVPMPGRRAWHQSPLDVSNRPIQSHTNLFEDLTLDDFQARFLMEREYLID